MNTYTTLNAFLGSRASRRIPAIRSTSVERREAGAIAVRYHYTDVVTHYPDGSFVLRTGGFHSSTTKSRINEYSTARVFQKAFSWFVRGRDGKPAPFIEGNAYYADGFPTLAASQEVA